MMTFRDGQNGHLNWRQPEWKCSAKMFDQHAKKALHGACNSAVQHDRPVGLTVCSDIFQLESFRQSKVHLSGAALPEPADGVFYFKINFRTIEGAAAFFHIVCNALTLQRTP